MKVCVVTGGIGSGKSAVCSILSTRYGYPVYDADSRAKELYALHPDLLDRIEESLGARFRDNDSRFVPSMLASRIFSDADALAAVEALLFPALMEDFEIWASGHDSEIVIFESATVLEKECFSGFGDVTLVVDAPMSVRLARAAQRDGVSEERILQRMSFQPLMNRISEGEKSARADYVIVNDSSLDSLEDKVQEFVETIKFKYNLI